jgi:hypothetical protein
MWLIRVGFIENDVLASYVVSGHLLSVSWMAPTHSLVC